MRESEKLKQKAAKVVEVLREEYPDALCTLNYSNAFELLIATQLAAQCTDERVNIVTKNLFRKYKSVEDFALADFLELCEDVKSTGFYHNKAKNILATSKMLIDDFKGEVPSTMEDLLKLPGVGRKTANVILGTIFQVPGIIVDTHAKRLSNRIGLTQNADPHKIELDLMKIVPKEDWTQLSHMFVAHGRAICNARAPKCSVCKIQKLCDYLKK